MLKIFKRTKTCQFFLGLKTKIDIYIYIYIFSFKKKNRYIYWTKNLFNTFNFVHE